ncbi:PilZ domain-containing protein [bacterium]|nr:PilZ domain-containing protein [bacterium]
MLLVLNEKRLSPRASIKTRVILEDEFGQGFLYLMSSNISVSGIFVEAPPLFKNGTRLMLSFLLEENKEPLRFVGEVARYTLPQKGPGRRRKDAVTGMGIHFINSTSDQIRSIENFIYSQNEK